MGCKECSGCPQPTLRVVNHQKEVSYGCPKCRKVFVKGNFTIEVTHCGESQVICSAELIECCQTILPAPLTFDTRAEVDEFVDAVEQGKITCINLALHKYLTEL